MNTFRNKIKNTYRKNVPELLAILKKYYPDFVYDANPENLKDEIPVFTLHAVETERFHGQLRFLSKNGYRTLTCDQFFECITGSKNIPERAVVLTFDDGCESVWRVAYPLLKEFGHKAISFIIPGLIDVPDGVGGRDPLCTWAQILEMHESGIIDFQSHTMYHSLIFTSPVIDDFMSPSFECYMKNFNVPVFRKDGIDDISRSADPGMPIYKSEPRFSDRLRYFDDEELRRRCIDHVKTNGGPRFFNKYRWRNELLDIVNEYRKTHGESSRYETEEEREGVLYKDLLESKEKIEKKLKGKVVNHLCYPWWIGSDLSMELSKKAGYKTNFLGMIPERRTTNKIGDDPYRIGRLLGDEFIFRLPGEGRKSLPEVIEDKFLLNFKGFMKKFKPIR